MILTAINTHTVLEEAYRLYEMGLNVFPQPYGKKKGYNWQRLQFNPLSKRWLAKVFAGKCNLAVMVGRTSRNLFVIDAETMDAFDYHLSMFRERDIPVWAVRSARGGHLWAFCADGPIKNKSVSEEQYEIRGSDAYVMCPPSLHPTGVFYEWLYQEGDEPPTVSISQLDWLPSLKTVSRRKKASVPNNAEFETRVAYRLGLSDDERVYRLLKTTLHFLDNPTYDDSNYDLLFKAACDLNACGFNQDEAIRLAGRNSSQREILDTIESAYSRSRVSWKGDRKKNPAMKWVYVETYIRSMKWNSRTGQTDLAVALSLLERAKKSANKNGVFRAAYRELQAPAMISNRKTLRKSLDRLKALTPPLLFAAGYDTKSGSSLWKFSDVAISRGRELFHQSEPLPLNRGEVSSGSLLFNVDDDSTNASERGALGINGMRVYLALCRHTDPVRVRTLANQTGLSPDQVRYVLKKLRRYQLADKCTRYEWIGYKVEHLKDLDVRVAFLAGKLNAGEKRERRLREQQREWTSRKILYSRRKYRANDFQ